MKNEIKANEYVRLKTGEIFKVDENCATYLNYDPNERKGVKHSCNLIDLIQCGDYVNGKEVKHIADFEGIDKPIKKLIFVDETHLIPGETAEDEDIKSVVTKEMMESISYKVKE